jgi:hypothetical protein
MNRITVSSPQQHPNDLAIRLGQLAASSPVRSLASTRIGNALAASRSSEWLENICGQLNERKLKRQEALHKLKTHEFIMDD